MSDTPTYAADFMQITLPPTFARLFENEELNLPHSENTSFFLHEWFHYIHNISTINGVSAFLSTLQMWSIFRDSIDVNGKSAGHHSLSELYQNECRRVFRLWAAGRRKRQILSHLEGIAGDENQRVESYVLNTETINEVPEIKEQASTIICKVALDIGSANFEIGTLEILEGVAWLLEQRYISSIDAENTPAALAPYYLLKKIAEYRVDGIDEDAIIACGITSLHSADPPVSLDHLLTELSKTLPEKRMELLEFNARRAVIEQRRRIQPAFDEFKKRFALDEPMGIAIRTILGNIENILQYREITPFFEFLLLAKAKATPKDFPTEIANLTCCRIVITSAEFEDVIGKDNTAFLGYPNNNDDDHLFGYQKIHAALHFMLLHITPNGFAPTSLMPASASRRQCPFYSSCTYELRVTEPQLCKTAPWESLLVPTDPTKHCWYRGAVRATRKPIEEFGLSELPEFEWISKHREGG